MSCFWQFRSLLKLGRNISSYFLFRCNFCRTFCIFTIFSVFLHGTVDWSQINFVYQRNVFQMDQGLPAAVQVPVNSQYFTTRYDAAIFLDICIALIFFCAFYACRYSSFLLIRCYLQFLLFSMHFKCFFNETFIVYASNLRVHYKYERVTTFANHFTCRSTSKTRMWWRWLKVKWAKTLKEMSPTTVFQRFSKFL